MKTKRNTIYAFSLTLLLFGLGSCQSVEEEMASLKLTVDNSSAIEAVNILHVTTTATVCEPTTPSNCYQPFKFYAPNSSLNVGITLYYKVYKQTKYGDVETMIGPGTVYIPATSGIGWSSQEISLENMLLNICNGNPEPPISIETRTDKYKIKVDRVINNNGIDVTSTFVLGQPEGVIATVTAVCYYFGNTEPPKDGGGGGFTPGG